MEAQLDRYLIQVEGGEDVIEARRRELARYESLSSGMRDEERLARLVESGEIKMGTGELGSDFWDLPRPKDPTNSVRRALEEDREDRF